MWREIGGEFHLQDFPQHGLASWPRGCTFFTSGRAALIALCRRWTKEHSHARLFVPAYFCTEVVGCLNARGIPIAFYEDNPQLGGPEFDRLPVLPFDMVLAVNYFGVRSGDCWASWRDANPKVALIEDHTHDPQSAWARSSKADFAFASLRKTIPVPDGAIAWSPRDLCLPSGVPDSLSTASAFKLTAMIYKRRYLECGENRLELKAAYLGLQERGENEFSALDTQVISPWSLDILRQGAPTAWSRRRERNVRSLLASAPNVPNAKPLFSSWPVGHCPLNPVYVFDDERTRDSARRRLISADVYPPVHWPLRQGDFLSIDLSRRILTIPVDFRCGKPQIERIAHILRDSEPTEPEKPCHAR